MTAYGGWKFRQAAKATGQGGLGSTGLWQNLYGDFKRFVGMGKQQPTNFAAQRNSRPVDEQAPASSHSTFEPRRSMAGVGVG
jgi:hypothetical protein